MQHPLSTTPHGSHPVDAIDAPTHPTAAHLEQARDSRSGTCDPGEHPLGERGVRPALLPTDHRVSVFSLTPQAALATRVCHDLGIELAPHEVRQFEDGEHKIRPLESVRGRDVYVVESLYGDDELSVNDRLVRMLCFIATLRDAGAERVSAVVPYLCYARKDRRTKPRDPVTSRYIAQLFEAVGTARIVCLDVHNPAAYQNAFRIPAEHLTAAPLLARECKHLLAGRPVVVVSPDPGGVKRAERFRVALERELGHAVDFAFVEKTRSEDVVRGGSVVGAVDGRVALLVDDLINRGTTLHLAAVSCRAQGAKAVYALATHGVFSKDAGSVLAASELERVIVVDTVPLPSVGRALLEQRVRLIGAAPLLASAILRLHTRGSLDALDG